MVLAAFSILEAVKLWHYIVIGVTTLGALIGVYWNHFDNSFHFDDSHTIQDNVQIRDFSDPWKFFKDPYTKSVLPTNLQYRPVTTMSVAADYAMAGGLDVFYFHLSNFFWYVVLLILLFFLLKELFKQSQAGNDAGPLALILTAWYAFHTVNAETINYIIARSDSYSTLCVVAGLLLFIKGEGKKWRALFLLPVLVGMLVKPTTVMFAPLLGWYILICKEQGNLKKIFRVAFSWPVLASVVVCGFFFWLVLHMTPDTWVPGGNSRLNYLMTQPYVIALYFKAFIIPTGLSADTDVQAFQSIMNARFFVGVAFIGLLLGAIFKWRNSPTLGLASFGFGWFLLTLVPSSSVVPLAEVMNDHRMFFPNIGLLIAVGWIGYKLFAKYRAKGWSKPVFLGLAAIAIIGNAIGTYQRNEVWHSELTLWKDVTEKSPNNGRGLMNYGLCLMSNGDTKGAMTYFERALELLPNYSYLHINLGVAKKQLGYPMAEIDEHYNKALQFGAGFPEPQFYYGKHMKEKGKLNVAKFHLQKCLQLSPSHVRAGYLLMEIYSKEGNWDQLKQLANSILAMNPADQNALYYLNVGTQQITPLQAAINKAEANPTPESYLEASRLAYEARDFEACVTYAKKALELKPDYAAAYNNICSAYNQLGQPMKAMLAGEEALKINPTYQLVQNNMALSQLVADRLQKIQGTTDADLLLNTGLEFYNQGLYELCISTTILATEADPTNAQAYNNICSAYNKLGKWDEAINYCQKALEVDPEHELAKNNLNWAVTQKGG